MCDYLVINLTAVDLDHEQPAGLAQYYYNSRAADKLISSITQARRLELGKLAAFEYETALNDNEDY